MRIKALLARWRRLARPIGRIASYVRHLHTEAVFKPGGSGAKCAGEEFYEMAGKITRFLNLPERLTVG